MAYVDVLVKKVRVVVYGEMLYATFFMCICNKYEQFSVSLRKGDGVYAQLKLS